jgi:hypothetical protein
MKELKAGDILHCRGRGAISRGIQLVTKSKINHTAMVIEIWGQLYIIDAQSDGVNPRPLKDWMRKYKYEFIIHRPQNIDIKKLSVKAMSKSGVTPYDFSSLLITQPIFLITGKWVGRTKVKSEKKMYCSEFIAWVFDVEKYWEYSPSRLYKYMSNNENFILV